MSGTHDYHPTAEHAREYERAVLKAAEEQLPSWNEMPYPTLVDSVRLEGDYPDTRLVFEMTDPLAVSWAGGELTSFRIWTDQGLWELSRPFDAPPPSPDRLVGTMFEWIREGGTASA